MIPRITGRFDLVVSLGQSCQVAYQLKRRGLRSKSGPFDWFTVSIDALLSLLTTDFRDFMLRENLVVVENRSGKLVVRDTLTTVRSLHDFYSESKETSEIVGYEAFRLKIDRRVASFRKDIASSPSMLFVRYGITREQSIALYSLLDEIRHGKRTALLVAADSDEMEEDWQLDNIYPVRLRFPKGRWKGNNKEWDKALGSVKLKNPTMRHLKNRFECHPVTEKILKHIEILRFGPLKYDSKRLL